MNWKIIIGIMLVVGSAGVWFAYMNNIKQSATGMASLQSNEITIYKSPSCGCCGGYVQYLKDADFTVNVVEKANLDPVKKEQGIPDDMLSCHTAVIGNYFIEGHVPIEAVKKLLAEKPDIDGIALPGMPAGSPGMHGAKSGQWTVYAIKNGESTVFLKV